MKKKHFDELSNLFNELNTLNENLDDIMTNTKLKIELKIQQKEG